MSEEQIKPRFAQWCIIELMGHRQLAGFVTEEELFGTKLLRIDIPGGKIDCPDCKGVGSIEAALLGPTTHDTLPPLCRTCGGWQATMWYGASAIYGITATTPAVALKMATKSRPKPVTALELPVHLPEYDRDGDRY